MKKPDMEKAVLAVTKALDARACKEHSNPGGVPFTAARNYMFSCDACLKRFAAVIHKVFAH